MRAVRSVVQCLAGALSARQIKTASWVPPSTKPPPPFSRSSAALGCGAQSRTSGPCATPRLRKTSSVGATSAHHSLSGKKVGLCQIPGVRDRTAEWPDPSSIAVAVERPFGQLSATVVVMPILVLTPFLCYSRPRAMHLNIVA